MEFITLALFGSALVAHPDTLVSSAYAASYMQPLLAM